jgi:uncharacterized iron-regulated membrane protein
MSLDLFIGIAGVLVTLLVVAGMILITPHGATTRPRPAPGAEDAEADAAAPPVPAPRPSLADV